MSSTEIDNIDKLYKNYDILNDAQDKISEVSFSYFFFFIQRKLYTFESSFSIDTESFLFFFSAN